MRNKGKNLVLKLVATYMLFCISWLFSTSAMSLQQDDYQIPMRPLRIGVLENNPPFSLKLPNQKLVGLYIDIWKLWSKQTGRAIEFYAGDYANNIENLRNGVIDFQSGLFMNDEREKWADFSIPIHRVTTGIFVLSKDRKDIQIEDYLNKRIAVGRDSFQEHYLKENYPQIELLSFKDPKQSILSLLEGRADAVVSEEPFIDAQLSMMGIKGALTRSKMPFLVNTVHALVPKGRAILVQKINEGLSHIAISDLIAAEKKWLPGYASYFESDAFQFLRNLAFEQQVWLRRHSRITMSYQTDLYPIEFKNMQGNYAGISSEYIHLISKKLGLKIISRPRKSKLASTFLYNDLDDIYASIQNSEVDRLKISVTKAYSQFPVVIVSKKESEYIGSMEALEGKKVGVGNIGKVGDKIKQRYPEINIIYFKWVNHGLDELQQGEIDAYIDNLAVVSYDIKSSNRQQIKIASPTPFNIDFSIGVKNELKPLVGIINQVLASINKGDKTKLEDNWLDYKIKPTSQYNWLFQFAMPIILLLGLFILYIYRSNRIMTSEIKSRLVIEKKLTKETDKAETANLAKDEFLSNMSHEIRTPMNTIVGLVQLLAATKLDKEQKGFIETLTNSTSSLQYLIEDILDLSDIVNHKLKLHINNFYLEAVILAVIDQANFRAKEQNQKTPIFYEIAPDIPQEISGDSGRLSQILLNLLSNAIKFTLEGKIKVSVKLVEKYNTSFKVGFEVVDSGIGMSKDVCEKLFHTYSQADTSTTRKYGGTGLGLSICKTLSEAMGGEIWVESQKSVGSRFIFTALFSDAEDDYQVKGLYDSSNKPLLFPNITHKVIENTTESVGLKDQYKHLNKTRLMVVDDNETNLLIVVTMLEKFGIIVFTANNGKECLDVMHNNKLDIILMDLQMPIMDGYKATQIIRRQARYQQLPIVAFSANVMDRDIKRALDSGMNYHLAKPFSIKKLLRVISEQTKLSSGLQIGNHEQ